MVAESQPDCRSCRGVKRGEARLARLHLGTGTMQDLSHGRRLPCEGGSRLLCGVIEELDQYEDRTLERRESLEERFSLRRTCLLSLSSVLTATALTAVVVGRARVLPGRLSRIADKCPPRVAALGCAGAGSRRSEALRVLAEPGTFDALA
jgi:hypothetical protein